LRQLVEEIQQAQDSDKPCTRLFFTKESKMMCLLNIVLLCGLKVNVTPAEIEELDYMTQITFELYERKGSSALEHEYSLRIGFSPGAHDSNLIDVELDSKHALSVAPRLFISDHISLKEALSYLTPNVFLYFP
jgi:inositol hexakisphosphate/diphosphoinositol-pentakisphosphate kinase